MPGPLRRALHQLVSEAVANCQEVLPYTEPNQGHTWERMTRPGHGRGGHDEHGGHADRRVLPMYGHGQGVPGGRLHPAGPGDVRADPPGPVVWRTRGTYGL
jgi:hypothetical protein